MKIENGFVVFENNEKLGWEKLLERPIDGRISLNDLREIGQARIKELNDSGYEIWARLGAEMVEKLPQVYN